jgi:hypothetical protein
MSTPKCQNTTRNPSELLTAKEAAAIAKISVRRVQEWVKTRRLCAVQQHPKILIDRLDLERFLHNRERPAVSVAACTTDNAGATLHPLTAKEAAAIAKVDASTVRRWVAMESLPVVQRHPLTLIDPEALDCFLRQRKPSPSTTDKAYRATTEAPGQDIAKVIAECDQLRLKVEAALAREQAALAVGSQDIVDIASVKTDH